MTCAELGGRSAAFLVKSELASELIPAIKHDSANLSNL